MLAHELSFWKAAAGIVVNHKRSSKNKPPTTDDFNATASSSLSLGCKYIYVELHTYRILFKTSFYDSLFILYFLQLLTSCYKWYVCQVRSSMPEAEGGHHNIYNNNKKQHPTHIFFTM